MIKKDFNDFKYLKSDLSVELPFTLTHPKPEPTYESSKVEPVTEIESKPKPEVNVETRGADQTVPVDHNLIEFDTR